MDRAPEEVLKQSAVLNDYNLFSSHSARVDACPAAAAMFALRAPHSP